MKEISKRKRFRGFTLIETLVSLSIISVTILTVLSIYSSMSSLIQYDRITESAVSQANNYLAQVYLAPDLKTALFDSAELSNLYYAQVFPVKFRAKETKIDDQITMLVNKKVERLSPLLVYVGIEMLIKREGSNMKPKSYWVETTFSEVFMNRIK
ncbi:MAG: hypothetical protein A2014_00285 [Spirochaetes bacterium GWF1_49_6]|nr:MAG: hypothetical protein A2014_00285 [Spirochaetes bacterium GWF1_49_6]